MFELIRKILSLFLSSFKRKKINLANYPIEMDYGMLNSEQMKAMDNILMACEVGGAGAEIPVLTQKEFDEVVTHIGMHFGDEGICKNIALKRQNAAVVNLTRYAQAKAHKAELDKWIEDALSQLNEGTTEYKLEQIAKYIANNARYEYGTNNPLDLVDDGAMCGAYSMLFYKMATRIGVQAYICYGEADNGLYKGFHAWNMVDGHFYDITFYDSTRNPKYLHSETPWCREYKLNEK
jgi:transglutaminase/protease-like cytokinesis protein 3